ncbi:MAG: ABC transporter ATP-binding protein [Myxococcales bacterium]|nr:ABC transporter ATP-binding protein [Myxococcales bacterium]
MASEPPASDASVATARSRRAPLLSLRGVTKVYGQGEARVHALRGIDLDIDVGEFVSIQGTSGSGKSTAMNILGLLDTPTAGEYRMEGEPVNALSPDVLAALRNARIGFVFQGFNLLRRTSAAANVELPLVYASVGRRERARRAFAALAAVGLAGRERATPGELSGGQQQRVAIARALVNNPEVILADEPTGNLDSKTSAEIMELLVGLSRDLGITIVMVTHDASVAAYARRHVFFHDGAIRSDTGEARP